MSREFFELKLNSLGETDLLAEGDANRVVLLLDILEQEKQVITLDYQMASIVSQCDFVIQFNHCAHREVLSKRDYLHLFDLESFSDHRYSSVLIEYHCLSLRDNNYHRLELLIDV